MSGREGGRSDSRRSVDGECLLDLAAVECILAGADICGPDGTGVDGDRMVVTLMRLPAGGTAEPHAHSHDQWIFVLEGVLQAVVGGDEVEAGPGSLVHVPAGTGHSSRAAYDRDVLFFLVKTVPEGRPGIKAA